MHSFCFLSIVLTEVDYSVYPKMKRKLATAGTLRLSPNEEAMFLKEEYERRRKLRLQQVCLYFCMCCISFDDVKNNLRKVTEKIISCELNFKVIVL